MSDQIDTEVQVESLAIILGMEGILPSRLSKPHEQAVYDLSSRAFRSTVYSHL